MLLINQFLSVSGQVTSESISVIDFTDYEFHFEMIITQSILIITQLARQKR